MPEGLGRPHERGSTAQRAECCGESEEVDVMIVQTGEQGAAGGVEYGLSHTAFEKGSDGGDSVAVDADVEGGFAFDFCVADQQVGANSRSTSAVSAPRGRARIGASRARGGTTSWE